MASAEAMRDPLKVGKVIRAQLEKEIPQDRAYLMDFREGTNNTITDEVVRLTDEACKSERTKVLFNSFVKHIHAWAREVTPSHAEWEQAIHWLTRAGKESTEFKNEFILFSDCIGLSVLLDELNHPRPPGCTDSCEEGPFFTVDSKEIPSDSDLAKKDTIGEKIRFEGTVKNLKGEAVKDAKVEVWQADGDGLYDIQYPEREEPNDRGRIIANPDGTFSFNGVLPTAYPIPDDGPIGDFLRALGRHAHRASHLHFMISAPGYDTLTSALYPSFSPFLGSDPVWATKKSLICELEEVKDTSRIKSMKFNESVKRVFLWKYNFVLPTVEAVDALKKATLHPTALNQN